MKRLLIATTAVALLAGAGAASAQSWRSNDGYTAADSYGYNRRGPMMERNVRLGIDPYQGTSPNQRTSSPDEGYSYRYAGGLAAVASGGGY